MKVKNKVLVYICRSNDFKKEILVFDHESIPEAGTQIVGGTVETNEDKLNALIREIYEEAGISYKPRQLKYLAHTKYLRKDKDEINERDYFVIYDDQLPDRWSHVVKSDGEDNGLVFLFYWLSIDLAEQKLTGNFSECLNLI